MVQFKRPLAIPFWKYEKVLRKVSDLDADVLENLLFKARQELDIIKRETSNTEGRNSQEEISRVTLAKALLKHDTGGKFLHNTTAHKKITKLVQDASKNMDIGPGKLFVQFYDTFHDRYGIDINAIRKEKKITGYEVVMAHRCMKELYDLALELYT